MLPSRRFSRLHVPSLDGIRGIAILIVIVYHFSNSLMMLGIGSPIFALFRFGWCGVDVFFALSGFLITGILLDSRSSPSYFRNFYARRVLRIFPLYYGSLLVVYLLWLAVPEAGVWGSRDHLLSPGSLLWPALYLENLAIALGGSGVTGVTTHYWSLAVEEHFYLVWPLLVWICSRRQLTILALAVVLFSVLARALLYMCGADLEALIAITPVRMDGLAIGALAALALRGGGRIEPVVRRAGVAGVAAMVLLAFIIGWRHTTSQSDPVIWIAAYPLVGVITAGALLAAMHGGMLARLLSLSWLRWLGKYSFGLYVWHPIIGMLLLHSDVAIVSHVDGKPAILLLVGATLVLDLVVAWLSYNLWEKRFLDLKRHFSSGTARHVPAASAPESPAVRA